VFSFANDRWYSRKARATSADYRDWIPAFFFQKLKFVDYTFHIFAKVIPMMGYAIIPVRNELIWNPGGYVIVVKMINMLGIVSSIKSNSPNMIPLLKTVPFNESLIKSNRTAAANESTNG
jgi:hypothetical protein